MILSKFFTIESDLTYGPAQLIELPRIYDLVPGEILQIVARAEGDPPGIDADIIISYKDDDTAGLENFIYKFESASLPYVDTFIAPFSSRKGNEASNNLFLFVKTTAPVTIKLRVDYKLYISKLTGL
jgi:hypothetical protein